MSDPLSQNNNYNEQPYNGANWVELLNALAIIATGFFFLFNLNNYWLIGGVFTFAVTQLVKSILNFVYQLKFDPKARYIRFAAELLLVLAAFTLAILFFALPATILATETLLQIGIISIMAFRALVSLSSVGIFARKINEYIGRKSPMAVSAAENRWMIHGLLGSLFLFLGFAGVTVFAAFAFFNPGFLSSAGIAGIIAVSFSALLLIGAIYTLYTNPMGVFSVRGEIAKKSANTRNQFRADNWSPTETRNVTINKAKLEEIRKILSQSVESEAQEKDNIINDISNCISSRDREIFINKDPAYRDIYLVVADKIIKDPQYKDLVDVIRSNSAERRSEKRDSIASAILQKLRVLSEALTRDSSVSVSVTETSIAAASSTISSHS